MKELFVERNVLADFRLFRYIYICMSRGGWYFYTTLQDDIKTIGGRLLEAADDIGFLSKHSPDGCETLPPELKKLLVVIISNSEKLHKNCIDCLKKRWSLLSVYGVIVFDLHSSNFPDENVIWTCPLSNVEVTDLDLPSSLSFWRTEEWCNVLINIKVWLTDSFDYFR